MDLKSKQVLEFKETEIGRIPAHWNVVKQKNVACFINGRAYKHDEFRTEGTPLIRIQNLTGTKKFVYSDLILEQEKYIEKGDLVYAWSATFGSYIWNGPRAIFHYHIWKIICDEKKMDKVFFYFKLKQISNQIRNQGTGSIMDHITKELMENYLISLPSLNEQKIISKTLFDLDKNIQNLQNQNKILEQIAQAIFKSWFVDFDGVTEFEDSELGKIPKGWSVKPLSEIMTLITKGTTPTQKEIKSCINNENYVNYLRVQSIGDDDDIDFKKLLVIPESIHSNSLKRSILQKDDIIYTIAGTIGRISIVESNLLPCNTNQAIAILRLKNSTLKNFVFYYMKQKMYRDKLHKNIVHAVQANLSLGMISNSKIILPPNYILEKLLLHIDKISQQLKCNRNMIQSLTKTRDALLPKLMSGEIRV